MMGVTSRCLASRDNLIKKNIYILVLRERLFSVQWHHCVVCTVCMDYAFLAFVTLHAAQRLLVSMYCFRSGGSNGLFSIPLSP